MTRSFRAACRRRVPPESQVSWQLGDASRSDGQSPPTSTPDYCPGIPNWRRGSRKPTLAYRNTETDA
ncbi:hypothetical protein BRC85_10200 [Halobacteriales archaeon QS_1_69_70]|nr:MAG: hypothetical protein BRC85_10200 [Halobacteriales archaeon QS_1_69_70]